MPNYAASPEIRRLLHWDHFPIHLYFVPGSLATKERKDAVRHGADQWVHAAKNLIQYEVASNPAQAEVTVTFLSSDRVPTQGGSCGHTTLTFTGQTLHTAEILLATTDVTPADLQATAAHEFGHALGIDGHSVDPEDLMYAVLTRSALDHFPTPSQPITLRDVNTLRMCYSSLGYLPSPAYKQHSAAAQ